MKKLLILFLSALLLFSLIACENPDNQNGSGTESQTESESADASEGSSSTATQEPTPEPPTPESLQERFLSLLQKDWAFFFQNWSSPLDSYTGDYRISEITSTGTGSVREILRRDNAAIMRYHGSNLLSYIVTMSYRDSNHQGVVLYNNGQPELSLLTSVADAHTESLFFDLGIDFNSLFPMGFSDEDTEGGADFSVTDIQKSDLVIYSDLSGGMISEATAKTIARSYYESFEQPSGTIDTLLENFTGGLFFDAEKNQIHIKITSNADIDEVVHSEFRFTANKNGSYTVSITITGSTYSDGARIPIYAKNDFTGIFFDENGIAIKGSLRSEMSSQGKTVSSGVAISYDMAQEATLSFDISNAAAPTFDIQVNSDVKATATDYSSEQATEITLKITPNKAKKVYYLQKSNGSTVLEFSAASILFGTPTEVITIPTEVRNTILYELRRPS